MPVTCVLFDHDDTLLPTFGMRVRCLEGAAAEVLGRDLDAADFLTRAAGQNLESIALGVAGGDPGAAAALVTAYRARYQASGSAGLAPFEGIPETLRGLRAAGVRVAVVTSKLGAAARRELALTGLDTHVETLVAADDVERHKPDPEPLERAMEQLAARPAETVMVGDTRADVLGARNAGITAVGALWGALDRDALVALAPDHLLERPDDLLDLLDG